MTSRFALGLCAWTLTAVAISPPASAQTLTTIPDTMSGLLRFVGFQLGGEQSARVLSALAGLEVSTAPLGTSTGAFTWVSDPKVGLKRYAASGFGPTFSERSLTSGRRAFAFGTNVLHSNYGSFGGQDLKGNGFRLVQNAGSAFAPLSFSALNLNLSSDTVVMFATAGVRDDLDVGIALPWVRVGFDAVGGGFTSSGAKFEEASVTGAASSGIGDISVFGKYRFWKQEEGGAAAAIELRLPSGSKDNLRGLGVSRTLISGVWSHGGTFSPHVKFGYEFWSAGVPISGPFLLGGTTVSAGDVAAKDQVLYSFGFEFVVDPRATLNLDFVGSTLRGGGKVGYQRFTPLGNPIEVLVGLPGNLTKISIVPGVKWNVWGDLLLTVNALTALSNEGLKATFTPVIGFDWSFHR
jgi:hypothetical protein